MCGLKGINFNKYRELGRGWNFYFPLFTCTFWRIISLYAREREDFCIFISLHSWALQSSVFQSLVNIWRNIFVVALFRFSGKGRPSPPPPPPPPPTLEKNEEGCVPVFSQYLTKHFCCCTFQIFREGTTLPPPPTLEKNEEGCVPYPVPRPPPRIVAPGCKRQGLFPF